MEKLLRTGEALIPKKGVVVLRQSLDPQNVANETVADAEEGNESTHRRLGDSRSLNAVFGV